MILDEIVARTRYRVAALGTAEEMDPGSPNRVRRSLSEAIRSAGERNAIIAEVKYASPSRGAIRRSEPPEILAGKLIDGGCIALSVLTEPFFFGGSTENVRRIRPVSDVPILRKDFIVDERQLYETAALGADAVLLIAGVLGPDLGTFVDLSRDLGLEPLVEVHTRADVETALATEAGLIGINNRDLATMTINLNTTMHLSALFAGEDRLVVSESGVIWPCDIRMLKRYCDAFLIGSSVMGSGDPARRLGRLVCA
ncbi:MAG: indole-3-glycerol phosphate synthase [Methanofollis sp.]|nr:indole-3-glycerol phosphate synthase [Methanofollis sp.]